MTVHMLLGPGINAVMKSKLTLNKALTVKLLQ